MAPCCSVNPFDGRSGAPTLIEVVMHPPPHRPSLDPTVFNNYQTASDFQFLRKIVEKILDLQLLRILEKTDYLVLFQSDFSHDLVMRLLWSHL